MRKMLSILIPIGSRPKQCLKKSGFIGLQVLITVAMQSGHHAYQDNIDVSDMCDIEYVLVLPFSAQEAENPQNYKTIPFVVTFADQNTEVGELMNEYREMSGNLQEYYIYFTLRSGTKLQDQMSMRLLKNSLGRENINGTIFFVKKQPSIEFKQIFYRKSNEEFIDECAVLQFFEQEQQFGTKIINLVLQIPRNGQTEILTFKTMSEITGLQMLINIGNEMLKNYGVKLAPADFDVFVKETGKLIDPKQSLINQKILSWSRLVLKIKVNVPLNRISSINCKHCIVIYKEGQIEPSKFEFARIADLTFKQLYESKLELNQSKQRKQLNYGLKVMDMVVKPEQKLLKVAPYFSFQTKSAYNIVGKVIEQKMVFYYMIPRLLKENQQFKIDNYIKIPNQAVQRRNQLRKKAIERIKTVKKEYFKNVDRLQPILIYTSELCYYQDAPINKKTAKIYQSLNRYLRENSLLTLQEQKFNAEWRYRYACALLTHLQKTQIYQGKAYRGISYDPKIKKGSIVTFKQFGSTSLERKVAVRFASGSINRVKQLFELNIKQGYRIKELSDYMEEEQVLLKPFSEFLVTEIKNLNESIFDSMGKVKTVPFRIYVLQQVIKEERLPLIKVNFVIWIDQNTQQSSAIFQSIQITTETSLLIQLPSTQDLKNWLSKYHFLFNDASANLIFITNMTRMEGYKQNQIAGIEGLREIRKYSSNIPVFFYISNIMRTNQKLVKNGVNDENILVGQSPDQVRNYLSMYISQGF